MSSEFNLPLQWIRHVKYFLSRPIHQLPKHFRTGYIFPRPHFASNPYRPYLGRYAPWHIDKNHPSNWKFLHAPISVLAHFLLTRWLMMALYFIARVHFRHSYSVAKILLSLIFCLTFLIRARFLCGQFSSKLNESMRDWASRLMEENNKSNVDHLKNKNRLQDRHGYVSDKRMKSPFFQLKKNCSANKNLRRDL